MENLTSSQYWNLLGNRQYLKQTREIQRLWRDRPEQHKGKSKTRILTPLVNVGNQKVETCGGVDQRNVNKEEFRCAYGNCKSEPLYECDGCRKVCYCSSDHQKEDWEEHRIVCFEKVVVMENSSDDSVVGARSDLCESDVGSVIFEEKPLVILPQFPPEGDYMVCIGCCRPISWEEKFSSCKNCFWPVCKDNCDIEVSLHSGIECNMLAPVSDSMHWSKRGGFESLWMIRILSLKHSDFRKYDQIMKLKVDPGKLDEQVVVPYQYYALETLRQMYDIKVKDFSDEELNHIWNVLRLKCFNSLSPLSAPFRRAKVLFGKKCSFTHSCYPNATYEMDRNFKLLVSTQRPINKNQEITINYDIGSVFQPTRNRRAHLSSVFRIDCSCDRCEDPTEFGTYFNGIPCHSQKSCRSLNSPGYLIQKDILDPESHWECSQCKTVQVPNSEMQLWFYSIQQGVEAVSLKHDPDELCLFLDQMVEQEVLHERHHLVFDYYLETLKLLILELEADAEKRTIKKLARYKRAARSVCIIMQTLLPSHGNSIVGPIPQISALIKLTELIESFQNNTVLLSRVKEELEMYVVKAGQDKEVVLRPVVIPSNTSKIASFIDEILVAFVAEFRKFPADSINESEKAFLGDVQNYTDAIETHVNHISFF